jgi:hypothetical protein
MKETIRRLEFVVEKSSLGRIETSKNLKEE